MPDIAAGADLVRRAFEQAKASGKDDWHRMTIPVLKNRILTLTGASFRESDYDATSFRDFLSRLPFGLITIDDAHSPALAILAKGDGQSSRTNLSYPRVRNDLWRAALDYSSGRKYVWDSTLRQARLASLSDTGPFLPTVAPADLAQWRTAFAGVHEADAVGDAAMRLQRWASEGLPTSFLPPRLRPLWNTELKRRVEERLQQWFRDKQQEIPPDLISVQSSALPLKDEIEHLRKFVLRCVREMTEQELVNLQLPARVALRVKDIHEG